MNNNQRVFGNPLNVERATAQPTRSPYAMPFYDENSVPPTRPFAELSQTERMRVLLDEVSRELSNTPIANILQRPGNSDGQN